MYRFTLVLVPGSKAIKKRQISIIRLDTHKLVLHHLIEIFKIGCAGFVKKGIFSRIIQGHEGIIPFLEPLIYLDFHFLCICPPFGNTRDMRYRYTAPVQLFFFGMKTVEFYIPPLASGKFCRYVTVDCSKRDIFSARHFFY